MIDLGITSVGGQYASYGRQHIVINMEHDGNNHVVNLRREEDGCWYVLEVW